MINPIRHRLLLVALCLCLAGTSAVAPDTFDYKAILGEPPDSNQQQAELEAMLKLQAARTADEVKRCQEEEDVTVFAFSSVLGPWFSAKELPVTDAFMHDVYVKTKSVSDAAKKVWNRKRAPLVDARIKPCVALEHSASYPSGHATRGIVWATLLAEMFPEHREALMARGREIGTDRTLAGMHYPSDVLAGQKLGAEIARRMLADEHVRADLEKAKSECLADAVH